MYVPAVVTRLSTWVVVGTGSPPVVVVVTRWSTVVVVIKDSPSVVFVVTRLLKPVVVVTRSPTVVIVVRPQRGVESNATGQSNYPNRNTHIKSVWYSARTGQTCTCICQSHKTAIIYSSHA